MEALQWLSGCPGADLVPLDESALDGSPGATVIDLSGHGSVVVPVPGEVLGQGQQAGEFREGSEPGSQSVNAGGAGAQPGHEAGARRVAEGRLAMGIGEDRATAGEGVDGGRAGLGVPAQAPDPVILIIDRDHQDVGKFRCAEDADPGAQDP